MKSKLTNRTGVLKLLFLLPMIFILSACNNGSNLKIFDLKCQSTMEPIGIGEEQPSFSWKVESDERNDKQSAYQIIVADNQRNIKNGQGNIWDSGKINSAKSHGVTYDGKSLLSNQKYFWKVRVWNNSGESSKYSQEATFITAILKPDNWQAKWIGEGISIDPDNELGYYKEPVEIDANGDSLKYNGNSLLLRKSFSFKKPVRSALVNVCGLGMYELSINGKEVGDKLLNPAKTNYKEVVLYDTYDVTDFFKKGENVMGIILGNGWFNPIPKWWSWRMQWYGEKRAILQMQLTFGDGTTDMFIADESWKMAEGPVQHHCIYDGETYDATKEIPGWDTPGFDDSSWKNVKEIIAPKGKLMAQEMPAIKHTQTLKPISITDPEKGLALVNFGQNFSGWIKIKLNGAKGDTVVIRYAEQQKDGMLDVTSNLRALAKDIYICKGEKDEIYQPRFTYHGFQFVEISGLDYQLAENDIEGIVVHSAVDPVGNFECSNGDINKIHNAVLWSQRANLMGMPTDCPQREERLGWMGDAHIISEEAIYNFDMESFYKKWLRDVKLNQEPSGDIPYIAPRNIPEGPAFSWSIGYHLIVWYNYQYYGDNTILMEHYSSMKKYVDFLSSLATDNILPKDKYGDWLSVADGWDRGLPMLNSTAVYYYATTILVKVARELNNKEDVQKYTALAEAIKKAFNQEYYDSDKKIYGTGSQYENAFPLFLNLVPETEKEAVLKNLVDDIMVKHEEHLTTGMLGTKYMMELLSREGRSDVAWTLATQTTYPSWLDMLDGFNTLSEKWNSHVRTSHNHIMFGSIDSWFYKFLAGIQIDEKQPGFQNIIIKPCIPKDLEWVKASVNTVKGKASVEWHQSAEGYTLKITIPFGSQATVYIPAKNIEEVKEGETSAKEATGVSFSEMEGNYAVFKVGSGEYDFISHL